MNIVAIGAHFDDIELGCGGALLKHRNNGHSIFVIVATNSDYTEVNGRKREGVVALEEGKKSARLLGAKLFTLNYETLSLKYQPKLVNDIIKIVIDIKPALLYTHFPGDQHTDHAAIGEASIIISRYVDKTLFYRSNFNLSSSPFIVNVVNDISDVINEKLSLIDMYQSEKIKLDRWKQLVQSQNKSDGLLHGFGYAETFMQFLDKVK